MSSFVNARRQVDDVLNVLLALQTAVDSSEYCSTNFKIVLQQKDLLESLKETISSFERKRTEKDPVTGNPRYGPKMLEKVENLLSDFRMAESGIENFLPLARKAEETVKKQNLEEQQENRRRVLELQERKRKEEELKERELQRQLEAHRQVEEKQQEEELRRIAELAAEADAVRSARQLEEQKQKEIEDAAATDANRRQLEEDALNDSIQPGVAGVEQALALLNEDCTTEEYLVSVRTLHDLVTNLYTHPEDPRFRSIRRSNSLFQNDVGRFKGGVQILIAVGYKSLVGEDGERILLVKEPDPEKDLDEWSRWFSCIDSCRSKLQEELENLKKRS